MLKNLKGVYCSNVKTTKNSNMGKNSQLVATSLEIDLVKRIDHLAKRDHITRSTWMREAMIAAWRAAKEFKRTPLHGYLATPISVTSARVAEEAAAYQTPKKAKK